jgi:hypothetical protein
VISRYIVGAAHFLIHGQQRILSWGNVLGN